ncbi:9468_t:CDS:1, partial [Funneliformis mosseae]
QYTHLYYTICDKYFPTLTMITKHKKSEHISKRKSRKTKISNSIDDFSVLPAGSSQRIILDSSHECILDYE